MSIEALKEQARRHEQKEQWDKALDLYAQAIERMPPDQPDIGIFNRAGDLNTRVGRIADALDCYNRSIELYLEAELPNNAIAVCKKIIRNVPNEAKVYLRMGQIRASQGFMVDARASYISYAEKVDTDEALRALEEFADKATSDHEIRMLLAAQMEQLDRKVEAAQQLVAAHRVMVANGQGADAISLETRIEKLDPNAFDAAHSGAAAGDSGGDGAEMDLALTMHGAADEGESAFGGFEIEGSDAGLGEAEGEGDATVEVPALAIDSSHGMMDVDDGESEESDEPEDDDTPLPMMEFDETEIDTGVVEVDEDEVLADFSVAGLEEENEEDEEEEVEGLPLMSFDDDEEAEEPEPLSDVPAFELEEPEEEEEEPEPLPMLDMEGAVSDDLEREAEIRGDDVSLGTEEEAPAVGSEAVEAAMEEAAADAGAEGPVAVEETPVVGHEGLADAGDFRGAIEALDDDIGNSPDDMDLRQRRVEYAFRVSDVSVLSASYLGLGEALERAGNTVRARAVFQQAIQADAGNSAAREALARLEGTGGSAEVSEVAATEDYVDLGSMILDTGEEKTTRFVVAYEEPSGDEDADFAKMLSQFKQKVSENLDADDVTAHYDLGTAYKEMGLLDEAISEYQQALRADASHLPTYEMLGQTFLEKGETEAAVRSLTRALDAKHDIEDELMGIFYYLARAHEALGNTEQAVEFYDRVFTLDINFADVTDRLRALRS